MNSKEICTMDTGLYWTRYDIGPDSLRIFSSDGGFDPIVTTEPQSATGGSGSGLKLIMELQPESTGDAPEGAPAVGSVIGYTVIDQGMSYAKDDTVKVTHGGKTAVFDVNNPIDHPILPIPPNVQKEGEMFWSKNAYNAKKDLTHVMIQPLGDKYKHNYDAGSPGNKWNTMSGWRKLFTGEKPCSKYHNSSSGDVGNCLQLRTDNMISSSQGILIGSPSPSWVMDTKARWMNPTGVQFQWSTQNTTKNLAMGLRLKRLWLIYKDNHSSIGKYAKLVHENKQVSDVGFDLQGGDILQKWQQRDQKGSIRVVLTAEDVESVLRDDCVCIGIYMVFNNSGQSSAYDNVIDIYNFKFLFHDLNGGSVTPVPSGNKIIVPSPHTLRDKINGKMAIA